jgi:hypothetical protein
MKRLYYLTESIDAAEQLSERLHKEGITDWNFHVLGKDKDNIVKHHLHSTTPLQELDIVRSGERGVLTGLIVGAVFVAVMMMVTSFGQNVHWVWLFSFIMFFAFFGAWIGGLIGVSTENYKIKKFHNHIEAGQYLLLVDVSAMQKPLVESIVTRQFTSIWKAGEDTTVISPFETAANY